MPSFFDLQKFAATGIASPDMTAYDKMRALSLFGGGAVQTLTGIPPLSFRANGKPLVSWSMLGNGQQQGTPTPDNPIQPEFVGVRTGQFLDIKDGTQTINNVVWTAYHGTITAQGTTTSITESDAIIVYDGTITKSGNYINYCKIQSSKSIKPPAGTYTFSANANPSSPDNIALIVGDNGAYFSNLSARKIAVGKTFSVNGNEYVMLVVSSKTYPSQYDFADIMLNVGSTALPYEPYGWKIPITCAGQTVPVYLGQVSTVRRIKKLVLTGEEIWGKDANINDPLLGDYFYTDIISEMLPYSSLISSHFITGGKNIINSVWASLSDRPRICVTISKNYTGIIDIDSKQERISKFKSYLAAQYAAGTPVTVWYVLAEPETAIVNEPLAKIGDYADELHSEDAGVTIPTAKGENTLTVDTELPPSEMTITYKE